MLKDTNRFGVQILQAEFSTKDQDNDTNVRNCSVYYYGSTGWWYKSFADSQLNGKNFGEDVRDLLKWDQITNKSTDTKTLKLSEMMVRRTA